MGVTVHGNIIWGCGKDYTCIYAYNRNTKARATSKDVDLKSENGDG